MKQTVTLLALLTGFVPATSLADEQPAKGMFLVATEEVGGMVFSETVILLLHYNEDGAMGLIVNRPTDIAPDEVAADAEAFDDYDDPLYFGGPVHVGTLHALIRTDAAPDGAEHIAGSVYLVGMDAGLEMAGAGVDGVRFYVGFAGWGPGQLDQEIARGSWRVTAASDEEVFAKDPSALWERLSTPVQYRAGCNAGTCTPRPRWLCIDRRLDAACRSPVGSFVAGNPRRALRYDWAIGPRSRPGYR